MFNAAFDSLGDTRSGLALDFYPEALRAADRRVSHADLAENLGKPSLWVNFKDLWYHPTGRH